MRRCLMTITGNLTHRKERSLFSLIWEPISRAMEHLLGENYLQLKANGEFGFYT